MRSIQAEIEISASPEKIWRVLLDFDRYPEWNPFIRSITGIPVTGSRLKVVLKQPEGKSMTFKPLCTTAEENVEFRWMGHLIIKGLFDGEHIFRLKPTGGGKTRFIQSENFGGLLLPLLWKQLSTKSIRGFELMNSALKSRIEEG